MVSVEAGELERRIAGEVLTVVGWSADGLPARALLKAIARPVRRFAEVAGTCDQIVRDEGFTAAGRWTLLQFASGLDVEGEEHVPTSGPVLVVSNHPGSVDALALVAAAGRDDLKIVAWPIPFLVVLPHVSSHLIFAADESSGRAAALRQGILHLREGGALLLFPRGQPEPDPATMAGAEAELRHWSRSIELFLRSVPETVVVPAAVGGVLAPRFLRHPVTWVRRGQLGRQRVAIVLQFVYAMRKKRTPLVPWVTFGPPLGAEGLGSDPLPAIVAAVEGLLARHRVPLSVRCGTRATSGPPGPRTSGLGRGSRGPRGPRGGGSR